MSRTHWFDRPNPIRRRLLPTLLALALILGAISSVSAGKPSLGASVGGSSDLLLVLDASGSMWGQIQGENKIVIARRVLGDLIGELDEGRNVALIAYGHRSEGDCNDIETVAPLGPLDRAGLTKTIEGLNPKGKTPITAALQDAVDLAKASGRKSTVILVSDGIETCGGDPCALVSNAKAAGVDFVLHVIGFDVDEEDVSSLECAAQAGGGLYLSAENAAELSGAMETAVALPAETPTGRLVVGAKLNGELLDVAIQVFERSSRNKVGGGRTYRSPDTNPRQIPLADGEYDVTILALGLEGNLRKQFGIEIRNGSTVEKQLDFSNGTISIGATRLYWQLREAGLIGTGRSSVAVLVTQMDPALFNEYAALASLLRGAGINCELQLEAGKLGKQLRYADRAGIPFAVIVGPDELAKGVVQVKDLRRQEQFEVPRTELVASLRVEIEQTRAMPLNAPTDAA